MKITSIKQLIKLLDSGRTVTHRGYPVSISEPLFDDDQHVPVRWEGSSGYHITRDDLPWLVVDDLIRAPRKALELVETIAAQDEFVCSDTTDIPMMQAYTLINKWREQALAVIHEINH